MEWPKQAGMANMEIGAEPRYPTPCMLLTANTGVSEFEGHRARDLLSSETHAPTRAREIIELFRL